ncbi:SBF-domain-containing protein, partial [Rhizophagus irregularis]
MGALQKIGKFAGDTFALWVLLAAGLAMWIPENFTWLSAYITPLLGIVMFGMGMTLKLNDFKLVVKYPKGVILGVLAQFIIMPLLAFGLAVAFQLPPELAVGVILVGCCPVVSVIAIVLIVAAVVSGSRDRIIESGLFILAIVILHNGLGYLVGYGVGRLFNLNYEDKKAVSIEVGMQNSGLGASLATAHFEPITAVPSAIFSFWHNISGPILSTYWSAKASRMGSNKDQDDD